MPPKPSLLVLRCVDIDITAAFYEELDLRFAEEQHGSGPRHLAYQGDGWVLELYPLAPGDPEPTLPPRLGLRVDDLRRVLTQVGQGTINDDGHALVIDPDGRKIDLSAHEPLPLITAWLSLSTPDATNLSFVGPQLGLPTHEVGVAGQPQTQPNSRQDRLHKASFWAGHPETRRTWQVEDPVNDVLNRLDGARDAHLALLRGHGLTATLSVSVQTDHATAVSTLDRPLLARLVDLEVELDLNLYIGD